jgi:hypothetical protein
MLANAGFLWEAVLRSYYVLKGTARDMDIFTFISTDHPTVDSLVDSA